MEGRPVAAALVAAQHLVARLALWLLPALLLVMSLELWMTRQDALAAANAAYDRSLLGALKSIDANISTASGGLSVELPYRMFEFFELTASGQVFFGWRWTAWWNWAAPICPNPRNRPIGNPCVL